MNKPEARVVASTTQAALENLSLQLGSERAWRLAYEMEVKWRRAEALVGGLRRAVSRLDRELHEQRREILRLGRVKRAAKRRGKK